MPDRNWLDDDGELTDKALDWAMQAQDEPLPQELIDRTLAELPAAVVAKIQEVWGLPV